MAPKPIEDIDFPALSDQIIEFFSAIWDFICSVCIVVWSYVSGAFLAAWTYPPFEKFRNELAATLIAMSEYVTAHPFTSLAIAILACIVIPRVYSVLKVTFLHCLGFRRRGVLRSSYAANYQSTSYGGGVPRGSTFAHFQSVGAKGGGYRATGNSVYPSWH